jgi:hypothetical protein
MKRTTVRLDDDLMAEAKRFAISRGTTLQRVIEDGLRLILRRPAPDERRPFRLVTYGEGGVRPGINLDKTSALLDLMDAEHYLDGDRDPSM